MRLSPLAALRRDREQYRFGGINSTRAESRLAIFLSLVTGGFSPYINGLLYYNDDIQKPRCRASTGAPPSLHARGMQAGHLEG